MTTAPALQALIERWPIDHGRLGQDFAEDLKQTLAEHPVVPLSELVALLNRLGPELGRGGPAFADLVAKYKPQPPNPHPQGTYLWAREENQRERQVHRRGDSARTRIDGNRFWMDLRFSHEDFTATDWEVVT